MSFSMRSGRCYQVLTRLGLYPDAVLGHSSGEILALSAAGVFETDRTLERELGRLGAIMSGFESSGDLPTARLVAVATHRNRAEAICRDLRRARCGNSDGQLPPPGRPRGAASPSSHASPNAYASRVFCLRSCPFLAPIIRRASARSSAPSPSSLNR